jgi:hypothetical protein
MTDWSRDMAAKLRKRSEQQSIQDAKFVEARKMKREVGPHLWDAVKSDLRAEGKALNMELGKELIIEGSGNSSGEFVVGANLESGAREARIFFSVETGQLTYTAGSGKHVKFELSVGQDGEMAFYSGMIPYSTGSIAKQILESLLD